MPQELPDITSLLSAAGIKIPTLLAGLAGGLSSLRFISDLSHWQKATCVIFGGVQADYFAPFIADYFGSPQHETTIGYAVGLFGLSLTAAIFDALKKANLWQLIFNRYGGGDK